MGPGRRLLLALALAAVALLAAGALAPQWFLAAYHAVQRQRAGADLQTLLVDDHRWAYLEAAGEPGTQRRPLVLLHGFTGSKENWLPVIALLAPQHRVIAPDLPGWGASTRLPGADYGFAAQALRLNAFLATLGLQDAVLVGHSMGGGIAAVAASQHPPQLAGLVLMDAAGVAFAENAFARAVLAGGHPFAVHTADSLERYLGMVFEEPPFVPWPLSRAMVEQRVAQQAFEQRVLDAIGRGPAAFLPQRAAPAIALPTLLLWCRGDRIIDASAATEWRAAIGPDVRDTVLLEGCNHMPMMERPAATAAALRGFTEAL